MAFQYRNSCYSLFDDTNHLTDFNSSEAKCQSKIGAHLVFIVNPFEYLFLKYYITQNGKADQYWIGFYATGVSDTNVSQLLNGLTIGPIISPNRTIMSLFLRVKHTNNAFFRLKRTERGEQANVPLKKHIFVKKN
jgi:hypothetical protein